MLLFAVNSFAQTIWTGYKQRSTAVVDLDECRRTISVLDASIFRHGDKVLLHQTTSSNDRSTGLCEFSYVDTVIGSVVHLTTTRMHTYDVLHGLQVVKVLVAGSAMVIDTLRTLPWNGLYGGIIAIECSDSLIVRGVISVDASGGRGGRVSVNTRDTTPVLDSINPNNDRSTGEGPGAAHGGSARNAGGGGGALAGSGGMGGDQTSAFERLAMGGRGGATVEDTSTSPRIFLGSGGGGGHQNDFHGTRGGHGGGIIIVTTPRLILGQNSAFTANGESANNAYEDGSGGGGSGGSIYIVTDSVDGRSRTSARGGKGGSTHGTLFHYGPGGGGGGGISAFQSRRVASSFVEVVSGGLSGTSICDVLADTSTYGATNGTDGASTSARGIPVGNTRSERVVVVAQDTMVPEGNSTVVVAAGGRRYTWRGNIAPINALGDSARTGPIIEPTWCVVEVTTEDGCVVVDSVLIAPQVSALPKLIVHVDNAHGTPGDTVDLYLRVRAEPINQRTVSGTVWVSMRATTLLPLRNAVRLNDTVISMEFPFSLSARAGTTYRRASVRVALGDSAQILLRVERVEIDTTVRELVREHGKFTVDGLCDENERTRLVRMFAPDYSIRGRQITAEADGIVLTDVLGKRITHHDDVRTGSQLSTTVPNGVHGLVFLTLIKDGRQRTYGIMIE